MAGVDDEHTLDLTPPAPPPPWEGRAIATHKLRLVEFSAFLEQQRDPDTVSFHFAHLLPSLFHLYSFNKEHSITSLFLRSNPSLVPTTCSKSVSHSFVEFDQSGIFFFF